MFGGGLVMARKKEGGADVVLLAVEADSRPRQARRRDATDAPPSSNVPIRTDLRFEAWIWSWYRQVGADGFYGSGG